MKLFQLTIIFAIVSIGFFSLQAFATEHKSGQNNEVDGTNTGWISLNLKVYPLPWGQVSNFELDEETEIKNTSLFPIHSMGIQDGIDSEEEISQSGDLIVHVQVHDHDLHLSKDSEDAIAFNTNGNHGPIKIMMQRGSEYLVLATAGGTNPIEGVITVGKDPKTSIENGGSDIVQTRELGPIYEKEIDIHSFNFDFAIKYTDGPISSKCPNTKIYSKLISDVSTSSSLTRFEIEPETGKDFCILQGDNIVVEYDDPINAQGKPIKVTDSSPLILFNGMLQSDKFVNQIGEDMILTLIDHDLNLDSWKPDIYSLDIIGWESESAKTTIGSRGGNQPAFNPALPVLMETGNSVGIFQIVIAIPQTLNGNVINNSEKIQFHYTDWGSSNSNFVGHQPYQETMNIFTSSGNTTTDEELKKQFIPFESLPDEIPKGIITNVEWWSEGLVGDEVLRKIILIYFSFWRDDIIHPPETVQKSGTDQYPSWFKHAAGWWVDKKISDDDFLYGIQYLIEQGIIQV